MKLSATTAMKGFVVSETGQEAGLPTLFCRKWVLTQADADLSDCGKGQWDS